MLDHAYVSESMSALVCYFNTINDESLHAMHMALVWRIEKSLPNFYFPIRLFLYCSLLAVYSKLAKLSSANLLSKLIHLT